MQIGMGIGPAYGGLGVPGVPGVPFAGYKRVVFVGASIMQQLFGQNLAAPNASRTQAFRGAGLAVDVYGYGWSGYVISSIRPKLAEAMTAFPADTLFVVHIGGNNVSNTRPYAKSTTSQRNAIASDYAALIADIGARKGDVILCPVTFRTYEAEPDVAALPNPRSAVFETEALGALPYNANIFIPAIAAWRPETINADGNPVVDLYNATRNSYETYVNGGADGVHPTNPVGRDFLTQVFVERLATFINGSARPAPIVPRTLAPANGTPPSISGTAQQGATLTALPGSWTGTAPIAFSYQWQRGGSDVAGATGTTYALTAADLDAVMAVTVTATNAAGSGTAASAPAGPVTAAAVAPANTAPPTVTGTPQTGQSLAAQPGTWTGTTPIAFAYQWRRDGAAIPGATAATYLCVTADTGAALSVTVTGSNGAGASSATSLPTQAVQGGAQPVLIVNFGNNAAGFSGTSILAADVNKGAKALKYDDGTASPLTLAVSSPGAAIGNNTYNNAVNGGRSTGVAAYDGTLYNNAICASSLYGDMVAGPLTFVIAGLAANAVCDLSFVGSRSASGTPRITRITDQAVTLEYNAIVNPPATPVTAAFTASPSGEITLTILNPGGTAAGTYAYVGGMMIDER